MNTERFFAGVVVKAAWGFVDLGVERRKDTVAGVKESRSE